MVGNLEKVGRIHTVKTCARDAPRPPTSYLKISGGIFHDCAVHDLGNTVNKYLLIQLALRLDYFVHLYIVRVGFLYAPLTVLS